MLRAPVVDTSGVAFDARGLEGLKQQARSDPKAALSKAAGQFEALFLQMVLKQMREALPKDGPLSSDTMQSYTALFDQQLAQTLSAKGVGLRKALEAQLARAMPGATAAPSGTPTNGTSPNGASGESSAARLSATSGVRAPASVAAAPVANAPNAGTNGAIPAAVQAFVERLRPAAEAASAALGVPAHLLLAQAGLETGWGRSVPGGSSNNLFGIKAGRRWDGASVAAATTEFVGGAATRVVDRFRAYASVADSFRDFAGLLRGSARYAPALANAGDPAAYAKSLQQAGYATDPSYADKLTRAIRLVSRSLESAPAQVQAGDADMGLKRT